MNWADFLIGFGTGGMIVFLVMGEVVMRIKEAARRYPVGGRE